MLAADASVPGSELHHVGLQALVQDVELLSTFVYNENALSTAAIAMIAKVLGRKRDLGRLHLKDCNIDAAKAVLLAKALAEGSRLTLTSLDVSHNPLGDVGVRALARGLAVPDRLSEANLENVNMGCTWVRAIIDAMRYCPTLRALCLCQNHIVESSKCNIKTVMGDACVL